MSPKVKTPATLPLDVPTRIALAWGEATGGDDGELAAAKAVVDVEFAQLSDTRTYAAGLPTGTAEGRVLAFAAGQVLEVEAAATQRALATLSGLVDEHRHSIAEWCQGLILGAGDPSDFDPEVREGIFTRGYSVEMVRAIGQERCSEIQARWS